MKMKKKEIIIFGGILVLAVVSMLVMKLNNGVSSKTNDLGSIKVTVGGEEFGTYALNKDQKVKINGTNTLRIQDGKAWMIEASCPDHICMTQDALSLDNLNYSLIVCLPNQVIVEGVAPEGSTESGVDGVTS